jgi:hypothetical protein
MRIKLYKMRSQSSKQGKKSPVQLPLEFEGARAYVIWDSLVVGNYELKARVEINPKLLRKDLSGGCDYVYRGRLILPQPEHN